MTKEEFQEWKGNKTTQKILDLLSKDRESIKEDLSHGATLGQFTGESTARLVGIVQGLDRIIEIEYEEPEEPVIYGH